MGGVFAAPGKENQKQKGIQQWAKTLKFWDKRLNSELRSFAHRLSSTLTLTYRRACLIVQSDSVFQNWNKTTSDQAVARKVREFSCLWLWVAYFFELYTTLFPLRVSAIVRESLSTYLTLSKVYFCTNFTSFWCCRWTVFYEEISRWDLVLFLQEMKMLPITIVIPVTKCKIFPS